MTSRRDQALKALKFKHDMASLYFMNELRISEMEEASQDWVKEQKASQAVVPWHGSRQLFTMCVPILVTDEFMTLCWHSLETFPGQSFNKIDFLYDEMLFVFETPIPYEASNGVKINIHGMQVVRLPDNGGLYFWHLQTRPDGGMLVPYGGIERWPDGEGRPIFRDKKDSTLMIMYVIMIMITQRIAVHTSGLDSLPRQAVRAEERRGEISDFVIVDLPRRDNESVPRDGEVEWSHRWLVSGHWRRLQDGRLTWISEYIKGPDDKPLIVKKIVGIARAWRS